MQSWLKGLVSSKFKMATFVMSFVVLFVVMIGLVLANSHASAISEKNSYIPQDVTKAQFESKEDFALKVEQDDDALLKIIEAKVKTVEKSEYQHLTKESTELSEVVSVPRIVMQNVSDKIITNITVIINDKSAKTNRGLHIREQNIVPGQTFTLRPEDFVQATKNPAQNPKFWLNTKDKSQVVVRVVATFKDGSQWSNKNFGGGEK